MKYTYLWINLGSMAVPFLFSFHPSLNFYRNWKAFVPALILAALPFVVWDVFFTRSGFWGFNPEYVSGLYLFELPLEEVLFFVCIPYCCLFTYHCLDLLWRRKEPVWEKWATPALATVLLGIGMVFFERPYTTVTCISCAGLLLLCRYVLHLPWLGRFYQVYLILLLPFLVVNGMLTGTGPDAPVVWYSEAAIMGPRIFTIPLEDTVYALEMILLNVLLYRFFMSRLFHISK